MKLLSVLVLFSASVCLGQTVISNPSNSGIPIVTSTPATCIPNVAPALVFVSANGTSGALYYCSAVNTWSAVGSSSVNITTSCMVSGGPITGAGSLAGSIVLDSQTGSTPYAIPTADCGKAIYRNNASAVADTLAQAGGGGNFPAGWFAWYQCAGAGGCTITPTTSTINGAASLSMPTGTAVMIQSDGTNYKAFGDVRTAGSIASTSSVLKGNGSGGAVAATSGTDFAPATSGSTILAANGSGGFTAVTIGSGLSFSGGTLSNTGGAGSGCVPSGSAGQLLTDSGTGTCGSSADWSITSHVLTGGASASISLAGGISTGVGGTVAGYAQLGNGTAPGFGTNSFNLFAPTSIGTAYGWKVPTAAATGIIRGDNSAGTVTLSQAELSGAVSTAGSNATTLATAYRYRTCDIAIGDTSSSNVISNAELGPQSRTCFIPAAATLVELDVNADAGIPNIIMGRNHAGTIVNIVSSALATAVSGGIACSNTGGTTGLNGATTCSATLQNTSLSAGDYLELVSGTAGGTAKLMVIHATYTFN